MLIECLGCGGLVFGDTCTCPHCGAEKACVRRMPSARAALLGITFATGAGCVSSMYSIAVTKGQVGATTVGTPFVLCDPVVLLFDGQVVGSSGAPLGPDDVGRPGAVTGTLTYATCLGDSRPGDPDRADYKHPFKGDFELHFGTVGIYGSGQAIVRVEDTASDTFRFADGTATFDGEARTMQVDGQDRPDLGASFSVSDASGTALDSIAAPDPFPFDASMPHSLWLEDTDGTLLIRLDALEQL